MTEFLPVVSLREVTPENYNLVVDLHVRDDQIGFVASNVNSLAEAYVFPNRHPLVIYADEIPVGFLMHVFWEERQQYWIFRVMIAAEQQGHGYGRAGMSLLLNLMKNLPDCHQIYISYDPENNGARSLYTSLGFTITAEILGGEEVARLDLS
jgi:diamine N-acetyltransferase